MNNCVNCTHYELRGGSDHRCTEVKLNDTDLVTGKVFDGDAYELRSDKNKCGPEGKFYDER